MYLQRSEHGMCLAHDTHDDGALLDGFLRVLDLEDAALGGAADIISQHKLQR